MMKGMNMKIAEVITVNRSIETGFKSDWLRKKYIKEITILAMN